jgi:DNA-binding IclR family transcriptional regulator
MDSSALKPAFSAHLLVQSRVFEAVASNDVLAGAINDLARRFGVPPDDFMRCLDGLVRAGWVTVRTDPDGRCSIGLEP